MLAGMRTAQVDLPTADEHDPHESPDAAAVTRLYGSRLRPTLEGEPRGHEDIVTRTFSGDITHDGLCGRGPAPSRKRFIPQG
jgi:hypothetical protein